MQAQKRPFVYNPYSNRCSKVCVHIFGPERYYFFGLRIFLQKILARLGFELIYIQKTSKNLGLYISSVKCTDYYSLQYVSNS